MVSDQLTIMVESSRLFLFTEYARKGCGVIDEHGTDYKVWEALPVRPPTTTILTNTDIL